MTKLYISPSSQEHNVGPGSYIEEKFMNLIADVLVPELLRHGFKVKRNSPGNTFREHVKESNIYKPDYHIAIHSNASGATSSHTARGCVVYCFNPDEQSRPGTRLAQAIYNRLSTLTPTADRGVRNGSRILSEVADTDAPAVLIEIDFHDNTQGSLWIMSHIKEISQGILLGILDQTGVKYMIQDEHLEKLVYRVQCGAFDNHENAELLQDRLIRAGFNAIIVKSEV